MEGTGTDWDGGPYIPIGQSQLRATTVPDGLPRGKDNTRGIRSSPDAATWGVT
jgi:hypothetical protein